MKITWLQSVVDAWRSSEAQGRTPHALMLTGAPGTLVARSVPTGLRFRSVELGKGVEGRGYRMAYAPLAA